jgi:2-polyprenyl-6-methoxyphenol hydroxylase-like FAD-dependent oxidoreductase
LVALGDAVCAFNPVYGQGMSVAAMSAAALHRVAAGHAKRGFARRIQREIAKASEGAWVIATGADVRYPTTEGRRVRAIDRLIQGYLDRVIEVSTQDAEVNRAFMQVVHLLEGPLSLFRPSVVRRVMTRPHGPILEPPIARPNAVLRPART